MNRPLLVIAHEATRTGSPRVLIELLRYVQGRLRAPIAIRLLAEGPLSSEIRSFAEVDHLGALPAAVLINSAAAAAELTGLPAGIPSAIYVHEEGNALEVLPDECKVALRSFTKVLCVSTRSREDLIRLGVDRRIIEVLPPVISQYRPERASDADIYAELDEAGIDTALPLVIGCGEAGWRKGADLFVDVARRVNAERAAQFAWIGRRQRSFSRLLDHDTSMSGLDQRLCWVGEVSDVSPYYGAASLLLMTSREDPQPLVVLEAAGWGTPTVGFEIGGMGDLCDEGAVETVPYPDTVGLSGLITSLLDDSGRREELASKASAYALDHRSIEYLGNQFLDSLADLLDPNDH